MTHTPTPPSETELPIQPDHQEGAWQNCVCADCMEKRLGRPEDHRLYTPHDVIDAWRGGYETGLVRGRELAKREAS